MTHKKQDESKPKTHDSQKSPFAKGRKPLVSELQRKEELKEWLNYCRVHNEREKAKQVIKGPEDVKLLV